MPNFGRWLNRDPLQKQGGINLHAYINGDPLRYIDPNAREIILGFICTAAATSDTWNSFDGFDNEILDDLIERVHLIFKIILSLTLEAERSMQEIIIK
ncbi:RHS repeat-associated core domain-containing protein [Vibrio sp. TRT 21S02]|uniref:RHS repeat-associated core domain-containing protein n=1 Tax=Vibrio sp. TRT 21S02 TaxID=3418507 RepID=UPI003CE97D8C